jgi:hypothetical protein
MVSLEEVGRARDALRERLNGFRESVIALYAAAELLTSKVMSTDAAVKGSEDLHSGYSAVWSWHW